MDVGPSGRAETIGWLLAGVALAGLVAYVLLPFVGAVVVGLFLYYATRGANRRLVAWTGAPRLSAGITLLLVGLPVLLVLGYATLVGVTAIEGVLQGTSIQELRTAVQPYLARVPGLDGESLPSVLRANLAEVGTAVGLVAGWVLRLFVALTVAVSLLCGEEQLSNWFRESFADRPAVVRYAEAVDGDVSTLYTGNLLVVGVTAGIAIVVFSGLSLLAPRGVTIGYPLLLGLLVGVGTVIPGVGMKLVYLPYAALLVWRTQTAPGKPWWFPVTFLVVTLVVVDLLPDTVVRSYVAGGDFHIGLVMLAYILGAAVFGWYGIFLAPLVLVLVLHFAREVVPALV